MCDMLGDQARSWAHKIIVSNDLLVFERKYVFVEHVAIANDGLVFELNPRVDQKPIAIKIIASDSTGKEVVNFTNNEMAAQPPAPVKRWRVAAVLPHGTYRVRIELEGHLAFCANVRHGDELGHEPINGIPFGRDA